MQPLTTARHFLSTSAAVAAVAVDFVAVYLAAALAYLAVVVDLAAVAGPAAVDLVAVAGPVAVDLVAVVHRSVYPVGLAAALVASIGSLQVQDYILSHRH